MNEEQPTLTEQLDWAIQSDLLDFKLDYDLQIIVRSPMLVEAVENTNESMIQMRIEFFREKTKKWEALRWRANSRKYISRVVDKKFKDLALRCVKDLHKNGML